MSRAYAEAQALLPGASKEEILEALAPVYERPGRTKQSFKDSTDINKIMDRARKTGVISHIGKYGTEYGDYSDIPDLLEAETRMARAREIFADAPAEIRREFNQDVGAFFRWVNDPANKDEAERKLVDVARRGNQYPVVRGPEGRAAAAKPATPSGGAGGNVEASGDASGG